MIGVQSTMHLVKTTPNSHTYMTLIAEFCIHLARLGEPLTKTSVLTLANNLIENTHHLQALVNFKSKHKIIYSSLV